MEKTTNKYMTGVFKLVVCLAIAVILIFSLWIKPSAEDTTLHHNLLMWLRYDSDSSTLTKLPSESTKTFSYNKGLRFYIVSNSQILHQGVVEAEYNIEYRYNHDGFDYSISFFSDDGGRTPVLLLMISPNSPVSYSLDGFTWQNLTVDQTIYIGLGMPYQNEKKEIIDLDGEWYASQLTTVVQAIANYLVTTGARVFYRNDPITVDNTLMNLNKLALYEQILIAKGEDPNQLYDIEAVLARSFEDLTNELLQIAWDSGHSAGFSEGQTDALNATGTFKQVIFAIFGAPVELINGVLDFDLFGINLAALVRTLITLSIVGLVVYLIFKLKS